MVEIPTSIFPPQNKFYSIDAERKGVKTRKRLKNNQGRQKAALRTFAFVGFVAREVSTNVTILELSVSRISTKVN